MVVGSRGHANLYIPSILAGSSNTNILKKFLELAIQTYIKYVDNSPCGGGTIRLYKGSIHNLSSCIMNIYMYY